MVLEQKVCLEYCCPDTPPELGEQRPYPGLRLGFEPLSLLHARCVISGGSPYLPEPVFPHLQNGRLLGGLNGTRYIKHFVGAQ